MDKTRQEGDQPSRRPGPVYDTAMRAVIEGDPAAACRLLGIMVDGPPALLPTSFAFPDGTLTSDLLLRASPGRLAHVEYERRPSPDLVVRIFGYRWSVMRRYPGDVLTQHVILLGNGGIRRHHDPVMQSFWDSVTVLRLQDVDPEVFLASAGLAPLAVLGRGDQDQRTAAFARALRLIVAEGGLRARELLQFSTVLAKITLNPLIIRRTVEEVGMSVESVAGEILRDTIWGRRIGQVARQEGLEEGREAGREAGKEQMLVALLEERFGAQPRVSALARQLAGWPDAASTVHTITTAASLDELEAVSPPK